MTLNMVGWIVVHSLWQGLLVAGAAALLLGLMRRATPRARGAVAAVALVVAAVLPAVTVFVISSGQRWRLPETAVRAVEQRLDLPTLFWWASVLIPVAGAVWVAGVAVGALRLALAAAQVRRLRRAPAVSDRALTAIAARLGRRLAVNRVTVNCSNRIGVPLVLGWRRPLILMPRAVVQQLTRRQLRGLLAHELEHVRRRDIPINIAQLAIDVLMFHHPAVRWLSRVVRTEREYGCDDVAISILGDPGDYIRALATAEEARPVTPLALAATSGTLLDRVRRIAGQPHRVITPMRGALACLMALAVSAGIYGATLIVPRALPWRADIRARRPGPMGPQDPGTLPRLPRSRTR
jgi:beta-lactamase regulating signal transducer with metallopeptidase domain